MEKIKKYVERFMKTHNKNEYYGMYANELSEIRNAIESKPFDVIMLIFDYGYAKGYRACKAEQKKGGAA